MVSRAFDRTSSPEKKVLELLDERRFREAEEILRKSIGQSSDEDDDLEKHRLLLRVKRSAKDITGAIDVLRDLERRGMEASEALWLRSQLLLSDGRYDQAIPYLENAVELWPDSPRPYVALGAALRYVERTVEARRMLEQALSLAPKDPDARHELTSLLISEGERDAGERVLEEYLAIAPKLASSHALMADYFFYDRSASQLSLPHYEAAIQFAPSNLEWYSQFPTTSDYPISIVRSYLLALVEAQLPELSKKVAMDHLETADQHAWFGYLAHRNDDHERAAHYYSEAMTARPEDSAIARQLAIAKARTGDAEEALRLLKHHLKQAEEALEQDRIQGVEAAILEVAARTGQGIESTDGTHYPTSQVEFLRAYLSAVETLQYWEGVRDTADKLIDMEDDNEWAHMSKARALRNLGNPDLAVRVLGRMVHDLPEWFRAWTMLAKTAMDIDDRDLARRSLSKAGALQDLTRGQKSTLIELEGQLGS